MLTSSIPSEWGRMAPVPLSKIKIAIKQGCLKAVKSYEKISGGLWLSYAPESYIQACIFQELGGLNDLFITLESSHKSISQDADITFRKKFLREVRLGRFDLVIWYLKNMPRAIVEVKKFYTVTAFDKDAEGIKYWMENSEIDLQAGFLVGYTEAKGKKSRVTLEKRFNNLASHVNGKLCWHEIRKDVGEDEWLSSVGLIKIQK